MEPSLPKEAAPRTATSHAIIETHFAHASHYRGENQISRANQATQNLKTKIYVRATLHLKPMLEMRAIPKVNSTTNLRASLIMKPNDLLRAMDQVKSIIRLRGVI